MSKIIVRIENVYADGSGAPATVVSGGYRFAADYLGGARLSGLAANGPAPSRRVCDAARRAYVAALRLHKDASAAWFEANRAMYDAK